MKYIETFQKFYFFIEAKIERKFIYPAFLTTRLFQRMNEKCVYKNWKYANVAKVYNLV